MNPIELKQKLTSLVDKFILDMNIDPVTGLLTYKGVERRFAGYPYIGSNYLKAPIKIFFISLDIGEDENRNNNTYFKLEDREYDFSDKTEYNPHIAGMYATGLYLLKDKMNLSEQWEQLWNNRKHICQTAVSLSSKHLHDDIMKYVAYDNRFHFVTKGRKNRSGADDRIWIDAERERQFLLDEIDVLTPDIVVFQGMDGLGNCGIRLLKEKYTVLELYHPSYRYGGNKLEYIKAKIDAQM